MTEGPYPNELARFMRVQGLTDPDLARLLEITKQQIFNLRHGHRKLTVEWARKLAPHLGVSWQELITGAPGSSSDPVRDSLLAAYDLMESGDRETLLRVAEGLCRAERPEPRGREPPRPTRGGNVAKKANSQDCTKNIVQWPLVTA